MSFQNKMHGIFRGHLCFNVRHCTDFVENLHIYSEMSLRVSVCVCVCVFVCVCVHVYVYEQYI